MLKYRDRSDFEDSKQTNIEADLLWSLAVGSGG